MPNAVERVEEFLKAYGMDPSLTDVDACARAFQRDMERGLQGAKDAWMMMLPTYLSLEGEVPEEEPTIVIDAGGTNFRIGLVTVHPEGTEVEDLSVFPMPGSQSAITWAEFIEQVSDAILPLTDRSRRVGLCFSYAAESLPNRDGRVLGIAKQVRIVGFEGMELGRDLSAALEAKGAAGVRFVVLNDTVAALLGGVAELRDEVFDGYVGLIYGTGVNTCYAERPERLKRVTTPWEKGDMLVNMESARFDGGCQGEFDRQLDQASVDPGMCHYEKMVSGRYQGEVVYRTLRQGAMDGLFNSGLFSALVGAGRSYHGPGRRILRPTLWKWGAGRYMPGRGGPGDGLYHHRSPGGTLGPLGVRQLGGNPAPDRCGYADPSARLYRGGGVHLLQRTFVPGQAGAAVRRIYHRTAGQILCLPAGGGCKSGSAPPPRRSSTRDI